MVDDDAEGGWGRYAGQTTGPRLVDSPMSGHHYLPHPDTTYPVPRAHTFAGRQQEKIPSGEEEAALCSVALRPMPRRLSLVWAGHSPLPVNLYCATSPPPEVGQLDRGGDELTKAGNARGITGEPPTPSR